MKPEATAPQPRTPKKIAIHALTGAIIGLLFALIPLSFAWETDSFQAIHIILSIGFVAFCGILSAISGEKFIDKLIDLSNFMPHV
jgi:hypothetical protein